MKQYGAEFLYRFIGAEEPAAALADVRTPAHPERRRRQVRGSGGQRQDLSPGT